MWNDTSTRVCGPKIRSIAKVTCSIGHGPNTATISLTKNTKCFGLVVRSAIRAAFVILMRAIRSSKAGTASRIRSMVTQRLGLKTESESIQRMGPVAIKDSLPKWFTSRIGSSLLRSGGLIANAPSSANVPGLSTITTTMSARLASFSSTSSAFVASVRDAMAVQTRSA